MKDRKKRIKSKCSTLIQVASLFPLTLMSAAFAQEKADNGKDGVEIIEVTGTYQALSDAAAIKRNAAQIVDAISATDIGKLPDTNIAEALQRITGVTINRDDVGDGTGFQIRGFSANALTINGKGVVTDGFDQRENNLNALSSSLVKALAVSKSPTADQIEGGSGGSVELVTFSPFDFEGQEIRGRVELNDSSSDADMGGKFGGFYSNRIEIDNKFGELGYLINLETEKKNTVSQGFFGQYHGTGFRNRQPLRLLESQGHPDAPAHPAHVPRQFEVKDQDFEVETSTISGALQWAPSERFNLELKGSLSKREAAVNNSRLWYDFFRMNPIDSKGEHGLGWLPGATWHTLTRDAVDTEYDPESLADNLTVGDYTYGNLYTSGQPLEGQVSRSMLTSGVFFPDSTRPANNSPIRSMARLDGSEKTQTNISLDFDWYITDDFRMETSFAISDSETNNQGREMHLHVETLHPETGEWLYPSLGYDITEGNDLPTIKPMWLQALDDADGNTINAEPILGFNPDYFDPAQRNDLNRLARLNHGENRTRGESKEWRMDFDWDVDFAGITQIEFGHRHDELHNFKDRSDMKTPYKPGFVDLDNDGLPDDDDGDGIPDEADRGTVWVSRTLTSLVEDPLIAPAESAYPAPTYEQLDDFLTLRTGLQDLTGDFPRQYYVGPDSAAKWDALINAVYGGHDVIYEDLQTEKMTEKTDAFYLKINFEYELANMPLTGNLGLRHVRTEGEGETFLDHCYIPWQVDEEKSAVVRGEQVAWEQARTDFNDGVGEDPGPLVYSYEDSALLALKEEQPWRQSVCRKQLELGGDRVPTIFQEPFNISDTYPARAELRTGTGQTSGNVLHKDWLWSEYDYSFNLPSLNLSLGVTDDMVVRFAAYKTMARPGANDLSMDPAGNRFGNPNLRPFQTRSMDFSWEWYISETDSLSIAYFTKDLIDQKIEETRFDPISAQIIRQPVNGGDGKVNGIEIGGVHTFDYLPEAWQGFGVQANYTYVDTEQGIRRDTITGEKLPIQGRSDNTYNLQFFYEKNAWSARIAYNWREQYLDGFRGGNWDWTAASLNEAQTNTLGQNVYQKYTPVSASVWREDYAQLDFSLGYKFSDKLGVLFKASNLGKKAQRSYAWHENATVRHNLAATFYRLSVNWKL
ncbi:TonB-dependent receptor [Paraglaciecola aquimarina]|uniref:TonB-dependent receptor n=1 Tax=Paraglaciecola algarum TaxID=3050085 RepID=A0ABS9D7H1_9ALTE|nr:TonB-dependent receptor [Paraglaciecola sp. G1-23]MCF2948330.1 TonB-dependent receptor [Paraglaciecola sp. G1-23]